jgi:TRAP-type C4-dicarboxylate transport system permease small subunit
MAAAVPKPAASRVLMAADGIDSVVGLVCRTIVLVTVVLLLVVLGANIVARYALAQGGISWISEVPEQLFPWLIAAGIILAVQHGAHIAVDLLLQSLGRNGQRVLIVAINVLVAVAYLILLRTNLQVAAIAAAEQSPILHLPRSLGYYALSFGAGLTALCSLTVALRVAVLGPEAAPQPNPEESVT